MPAEFVHLLCAIVHCLMNMCTIVVQNLPPPEACFRRFIVICYLLLIYHRNIQEFSATAEKCTY